MTFQLGAALLDVCVLAILSRGDTYGYVLTQDIKQVVDISESTLYPVLRRLQREGCLQTYDQPFQGRNRRYYAIADPGRAALASYMDEWTAFKEKIDAILQGGIVDD